MLIAVDVGNSRIKWGQFQGPELLRTATLPLGDGSAYGEQQRQWQLTAADTSWAVASVNPDGLRPLLAWLAEQGYAPPLVLEQPSRLPLRVELDRPAEVGMDRLLAAVAANQRRPPGCPAIIVDCGSAITIDAISHSGAFLGGAILPGVGLSARALHQFTYWLPLVEVSGPPLPLGKSTTDAMRSGLFWGTVGAVRQVADRIGALLGPAPVRFLSGGDALLLAPHLGRSFQYAPHLTLHGIYLASRHVEQQRS